MVIPVLQMYSGHPTNRRTFLRQMTSVVAAGVGANALRAQSTTAGPSFRFIVINDLHHGSAECDPFFRKLIAQIRRHESIEFCVIVGDLADTGKPASLATIRRLFSELPYPFYAVPGNHDCDVEQTTRLYSEVFPDQLNYRFDHQGWEFVAFDSTEGNHWGGTMVQPETLAWLDATLPELDRSKPTVGFTHFPLSDAARQDLTPLNAPEVLARFDTVNLRCMFNGHFHARTEGHHGKAVVLTNACCSRVRDNHDGSLPEGYIVCTAYGDGRLDRDFVEFAPAIDSVPDADA